MADPVITGTTSVVSSAGANISLLKGGLMAKVVIGLAIGATVLIAGAITVGVVVSRSIFEPPRPADDYVQIYKGTEVVINVLLNDVDPKGAPLFIQNITSATYGSNIILDSSLGTIVYNPSPHYGGNDTFQYTVSNDKLDSVANVYIIILNHPPEPADDVYLISKNSKDNALSVLHNDFDIDGDLLSIVNITKPLNGTTSVNASHVFYTPNVEFNGADFFTYTVFDGNDTASALVRLNIDNNAPVPSPDFFRVPKNTLSSLDVLANDYDANNDELTITRVRGAKGFAFGDERGKMVTYVPEYGTVNVDSFEYEITDGVLKASSYAIVQVFNTPPKADNYTIEVPKNTKNVPLQLHYDDSDPLESLIVQILQPPANNRSQYNLTETTSTERISYGGGITKINYVNRSYRLTYTPEFGRVYEDTILFTVFDGQDSSVGKILIATVNTPPVAVPDFYTCLRGAVCVLPVLENDYDKDSDPIRLLGNQPTIVSTPQNITLLINPALTNVTYRAPKNFVGNDTFYYTIEDVQVGDIGSKTAKALVTVQILNTPPVANPDVYQVSRGSVTDFYVLTNDVDADQDYLTITGVARVSSVKQTAVTDGSQQSVSSNVTIASVTNALGTTVNVLRYVASTTDGYYSEYLTYTISDGYGGVSTTTVNITVVNTPPFANNDNATVHWNTTSFEIDVLANDVDANTGDQLLLSIASIKQNANTNATSNGFLTSDMGALIENKQSKILYTPAKGFVGVDTFYYYCTDSLDVSRLPAMVTVRVTNSAPIARNDSVTMKWGSSIDVRVKDNDSDPDSDPIAVQYITRFPNNGTAALVNGATPVITYTPNSNFIGNDIIQYIITDWNLQSTAFVNIQVIDTAPQPQPDYATVHWRQTSGVTINVLSNDTDPDGDTLLVHSIGRSPSPAYGSAQVSADKQTVLFKPTTSNIGTTSFSYFCSDSILKTEADVTVLITNKNAPIANDLYYRVHWRTQVVGTDVSIFSSANAVDSDGDPLSIAAFSSAKNGAVTKQTSANGLQYLNYRQSAGFLGNDTFLYTITDGQANATASVYFSIYNNKPTTTPFVLSRHWREVTTSGFVFDILSTAQDADSADVLSVSQISCDDTVNCGIELNQGKVVVKPKLGYIGVLTARFSVSDGLDVSNNTISLTVFNSPPVATPKSFTIHWSAWTQGALFDVLTGCSDPNAQDTVSLKSVASPSARNGTVSLSTSSSALYTPVKAVIGLDTFSYSVTDGNLDATALVTVNVTNRPPVAVNDTATISWNATISGVVILPMANDNDPDSDAISIVSFQQPAKGTVSFQAGDATKSRLIYTPPTAFPFVGQVAFQYTITDGVQTASAYVIVTVTNNNGPVAADLSYVRHWTTQTNGTKVYPLESTTVTDADGDRVSLISATMPASGTAQFAIDAAAGVTYILYKQYANYLGNDTFTYQLTDGQKTAVGNVYFRIYDDAPTTKPFLVVMHWSQIAAGIEIDVLAEAEDVNPEDTLSIASVQSPSAGQASITASKKVLFKPNSGYSGTTSFPYTVTDGLLNSTNTIQVIVTNSVPNPLIKQYTIHWRTQFTGSIFAVLANITDPEGDPLSLSSISSPAQHGKVTIVPAANTVNYTQTPKFLGVDNFVVVYTDGSSFSNITVYVTVYNNPPVTLFKTYTVHWSTWNNGTVFDVLNGSTDADNDTITLESVTQPANSVGSVVIQSGKAKFTPTKGFVGTTSFTYTANDGLASVTKTVTVSVVDLAPLPSDKSYSVHWSKYVSGQQLAITQGDSDPDSQDSISLKSISSITPTPASLTGLSVAIVAPQSAVLFKPPPPTSVGVHPWLNKDVTFVYTITDGALDANALIRVKIVNSDPVARPDSYVFHWSIGKAASAAVKLSVLQNDTDADSADMITLLSASSITNPAASSISLITNNTEISYKPPTGFIGTDQLQYVCTDGAITVQGSAQVVIYNNAPVTVALTQTKLWRDATAGFVFNVIANASDIDATAGLDTLTIKSVTNNPNAVTSIQSGAIKVTPNSGFIGTIQLTYTVTDGLADSSNTITAIVTNQPPVATPKQYTIHWSTWNAGILFDVKANSTDADADTISLVGITTSPQHGTAALENGQVRYRPTKGYLGADSLQYAVSDTIATTSAAVDITVINQIPIGSPKSYRVHWSKGLIGGVFLNITVGDYDPDTADTASLQFVSAMDKPQIAAVSGQTNYGVQFVPAYPPVLGNVSFTYSLTDGVQSSNLQPVIVTVYNTPPVGNNDYYRYSFAVANAAGGVVLNVLANDTDADGDSLSIKSVISSSPSTASISIISNGKQINYRHLSIGVKTYAFQYIVTDGAEERTVNVYFELSNRAPIAVDDAVITKWSQDVVINTMANDYDLDNDTLSFVSLGNSPLTPSPQGQLSQVNAASRNGVLTYTVPAKSSFTYTQQPAADGAYKKTEYFVYTITDPIGSQSSASVAVTVYNFPPVVYSTAYSVPRNNPSTILTLPVMNGAWDADNDTLTLTTVSRQSGISGGSAVKNANTIVYTPPLYPYKGAEVLSFTVSDGQLLTTAQATVTVTNTAPVCVGSTTSVSKSTSYAFDLLASPYCTDVNKDPLTLNTPTSAQTQTTSGKGALSLVSSNTRLIYQAKSRRSGADSVDFRANDGDALSNIATLNMNIVNRAPVASNDYALLVKGSAYTFDPRINDNDPDIGDSIVLVSISNLNCLTNAGSSATITAPNKITIQAASSITTNITCQFTYTITDDDLDNPLTSSATVTVDMIAHDPVAVPDYFSTPQGSYIDIPVSTLLANDYDLDSPKDVVTFLELVPCTDALKLQGYCHMTPQLTTVSGIQVVRLESDPFTCKADKFRYRIITPTDSLKAETFVVVEFTNCRCYDPIDVMLVYDGSGSVGETNWNTLKSFTLALIDKFAVSATQANIGLITFSTKAQLYPASNGKVLIDSKDEIKRVINQDLEWANGWTGTLYGLNMAVRNLQASARPNVPKVLVVMTDGEANRPNYISCNPRKCKNGCTDALGCDAAFCNLDCTSGSCDGNAANICYSDPTTRSQQINSWKRSTGSAADWKIVALGIGADAVGATKIQSMNYDPSRYISVDWNNLNLVTQTILDQACNTQT